MVLALVGAAAGAQADEKRGFTLGVGASVNKYEYELKLSQGTATTVDGINDDVMGFGWFVGYRFSPYIAVEGHYFDLGEAKKEFFAPVLDGSGNPIVDSNGRPIEELVESFRIDGKAYGISALGTYPIRENFAVTGRVGFLRMKARYSYFFTPVDSFTTTTENKPFFGVGLQTYLDGAQVRLEYSKMDFGSMSASDPVSGVSSRESTDLDQFQLSVAWMF